MPPRTRSNTGKDTLPEGVEKGVGTSNPMPMDELTSLMSNIMAGLKELKENQVTMHVNQNVLFEEITVLNEARPSRSITPRSGSIPHHAFEGTMRRVKTMGGMTMGSVGVVAEDVIGIGMGCMGGMGIGGRGTMVGESMGTMGGMIGMGGIDTMRRSRVLDMMIPLSLSSTLFPSSMASLIPKPTWNGSPKWTRFSHSIITPMETR